ncbi:hypothetical protein [Wenjunlia vitaminophila]|uniref:hypothetical protein n=1 Tax=Wenjunlia vitaminophila TaxID=76728 RepID=UPI00037A647A|nr:hypothetical protein [Wenjunlia vitaminophila]
MRRTVTAVGCAAALTVGVVACGTVENLSAGQKVSRAMDRLVEGESLSVTVDLESTPDQLMAMVTDSSDPMPPEAADVLANSTIKLSVKADKPLKDAKESDLVAAELVFAKGNTNLFELRVVEETAYVRADLEEIAAISGEEMPPVETIKSELPPGSEFAERFLDGGWVAMEQSELEKSSKIVEDYTGEDTGWDSESAPSLSDSAKDKIFGAVKQALGQGVTIEEKGKKDGTEHLRVSAPARTLLNGLVDKLKPLESEIPGAELPSSSDIQDVPNRRVAMDMFLKGKDLKKLTVDMAQFDDELRSAGKLPLSLSFDKGGMVWAPKDAVKITSADLESLMNGAAGSNYDDGGTFEDDNPFGGDPADDNPFGDASQDAGNPFDATWTSAMSSAYPGLSLLESA